MGAPGGKIRSGGGENWGFFWLCCGGVVVGEDFREICSLLNC